MIRYLGSWLWYKISLNLVGAWYLIREQVILSLALGKNTLKGSLESMLGMGSPPAAASSCGPGWQVGGYDGGRQGNWGEGCQKVGKNVRRSSI